MEKCSAEKTSVSDDVELLLMSDNVDIPAAAGACHTPSVCVLTWPLVVTWCAHREVGGTAGTMHIFVFKAS